MTGLRSKIPKRIGVIVSCERPWEISYIYYQIDLHGFLRLPIVQYPSGEDPKRSEERKAAVSRLSNMDAEAAPEVKTGSLQALIICCGRADFEAYCNFFSAKEAFGVDPGLREFLRRAFRRGLPIGALGYAVPLLVKSIQGLTGGGAVVTVGNDPLLQSGIEAAGAQAVVTRPTEVIIDETNRLVTSGGEHASNRPTEVAAACENVVKALIELIKG